MSFTSLDFAVFFPIVFILYWFVTVKNLRIQNLMVLFASYVFYGYWDWRFLSLIAFSTLVDYTVGIGLSRQSDSKKRRLLLWTSILANVGMLAFFKYYNFFIENFVNAFSFFGSDLRLDSLNIILPVGISFYTFQTLSYTIDIYRGKLQPTKDFVAFASFVSFFPQLVAGPIERATHFLPQFFKSRKFEYGQAVDGLRQILWGFFKKVVIADNCAQYANEIFNNSGSHSGSILVLGAFFFTVQLYCDFSGYSDIAIGISRLLGFNLKQNFAFPFFSRDIAEFWRRWHISLSTWFRDYLYIPLGGSRGSNWVRMRNILIIFLVSGFWHGAAWHFVFWGLLNALYFLPLLLVGRHRTHLDVAAQDRLWPSFREILNMVLTFGLTAFAMIFFRAGSLTHAFSYVSDMVSVGLLEFPSSGDGLFYSRTIILLIIAFFMIEWFGRKEQYALEKLGLGWKPIFRYIFYYAIIIAIIWFRGKEQEFIYFQF